MTKYVMRRQHMWILKGLCLICLILCVDKSTNKSVSECLQETTNLMKLPSKVAYDLVGYPRKYGTIRPPFWEYIPKQWDFFGIKFFIHRCKPMYIISFQIKHMTGSIAKDFNQQEGKKRLRKNICVQAETSGGVPWKMSESAVIDAWIPIGSGCALPLSAMANCILKDPCAWPTLTACTANNATWRIVSIFIPKRAWLHIARH